MKPLICQCYGLNFSPKMGGANLDHSRNLDYCADCFRDRKFRDDRMTIQEMEKKLLCMAKHQDEMSIEEAYAIINTLPNLKRWKK